MGWGRKPGRGLAELGGGRPGGSEKRKTEEREEIRRQKPQSGFQRLLGKRPICMVGGATPPARATKNGRLLTNRPPGVGRRTLELTNARSPRFLRPLLCLGGTDPGRGAFPGDPRQSAGRPAERTPGAGLLGSPSRGSFRLRSPHLLSKQSGLERVAGDLPSPPGTAAPRGAPEHSARFRGERAIRTRSAAPRAP